MQILSRTTSSRFVCASFRARASAVGASASTSFLAFKFFLSNSSIFLLLNSSSHPRIMNAHHTGTNGEKEKRKRLRSQTRALCCVRAWKARISLSRNGFLLGEEKRLENSEGKYSSYSAYLIIFHCLVVRKRKRQKMHLLPKPIWNLTLTIEQQQTRARKCRKRCERDFDFYTYFKPLDV